MGRHPDQPAQPDTTPHPSPACGFPNPPPAHLRLRGCMTGWLDGRLAGNGCATCEFPRIKVEMAWHSGVHGMLER